MNLLFCVIKFNRIFLRKENTCMETVVIDDLVEEIAKCVEKHRLAAGQYSRWLWDNGSGRNVGINEYGCADAANIYYTIGRFPQKSEERAEWIKALQNMQDKETGLFSEPTHHTIHTTAHCTAALELFDAKPLYKCKAFEKYTTKEGLYDLLENEVDWQNPWPNSHKGAGILPSLVNTDMVGLEWKNDYFDWMWEHSDPETGFFYYSANGETRKAKLYAYMAGGFHYIFNHESEHRPLRYPEKIIDSCLWLLDPDTPEEESGWIGTRSCNFIEVDAVYALSRAMRQTPYKFKEGKQSLEAFAERYLKMLYAVDKEHDEKFNDLHMLFGAVCCIAELQSALPGKILTTKPLRLVLDRRPFI